MKSALEISCAVTGLFLIRELLASSENLLSLNPIILCVVRAFSAHLISLAVNLVLFSATVLRRDVDPF